MNYVALLRGIMPSNPNMKNEKLRTVFESLGFSDVSSLLSSGNIIFATSETDVPALEGRIQNALQTTLGIGGGTIIRSQQDLQDLMSQKPYGDQSHDQQHYQLVTFFKKPFENIPIFDDMRIVYATKEYICTSTDTTAIKTPNQMAQLEKRFGKDITSRTMKTVERIVAKMNQTYKKRQH